MKAMDIMARPMCYVYPRTPARDLTALLVEYGYSDVPVVDAYDRVVGVISESDVLRDMIFAVGGPAPELNVGELMTTPAMTLPVDADVATVVDRMLRLRLHSMPIVNEGVLVGVVTRHAVLRTLVTDDDLTAARVRRALTDYAPSSRAWSVDVHEGVATITGKFADEAERRMAAAVAETTASVKHADVYAIATGAPTRADR